MTDQNAAYEKARRYFFALYRAHLAAARAWRGKNRRQELWALELAEDCRLKLIHGANLRAA